MGLGKYVKTGRDEASDCNISYLLGHQIHHEKTRDPQSPQRGIQAKSRPAGWPPASGAGQLKSPATGRETCPRAVHRGLLIIEGRPPTGLRFLHADGTVYGGAVSPHEADLKGKVFRGLRRLGLTESEARRALSSTHVGPETTLQNLLEEALSIHRNGGQAARAA